MSIEDAIYPLLNSYTNTPQWVKSAVGAFYSAIPLSWRKGAAYEQFRQVLAVRDEAGVRAYARQQLAESLCWAVTGVPAYRNIASAADCLQNPEQVLAAMPLVSKAEIKADLSHYLSVAEPLVARMKTYTGGSTAEPMMFYLQKGVTRAREYAFMEAFHARVGLTDQDVVLALRGRAVPTSGRSGGRLWMYEPIKRQLILSSVHLEPKFMPEYMVALRQ